MTVEVPVLSRAFWLGAASATLAAAMAGSRGFSLSPGTWVEKAVIEDSSEDAAVNLLGAWSRLGGGRAEATDCTPCGVGNTWPSMPVSRVPGFSGRYDPGYLRAIVEKLCWKGDPAGMTIADLACATASSLCGCKSIWEGAQPLVLLRSEFYRFARGYGASKPVGAYDVAKTVEIPAFAQALALLAHYATIAYRGQGWSFSLSVDPEVFSETGGYSGGAGDAVEYYRAAKGLVATASSRLYRERGDVPWSVVILSAATAYFGVPGIRLPADSLLAARISYGNRVTLLWAGRVPASPLVEIIERAAARAGIGSGRRVYVALSKLLSITPAAEGVRKRLPDLVQEYAHYMVEYASGSTSMSREYRPVDAAYSAARVMALAARDLDREGYPDLAREARLLSELAAEAARV